MRGEEGAMGRIHGVGRDYLEDGENSACEVLRVESFRREAAARQGSLHQGRTAASVWFTVCLTSPDTKR